MALIALGVGVVSTSPLNAEPVSVRYSEGVSRGFLRLLTTDGAVLADGELTQRRLGSRITSRLLFRFRDGSVYDENTVFTQQQHFRLLTDHVVQRGPAFPQPMDLLVDAGAGIVTVRYQEGDEQKVTSEHLDLPADVANGVILTLLKNLRPDAPPQSFAYVAATPKPRVVHLAVSVSGRDRFSTGHLAFTATHYVLKVDLKGITGALASITGKLPPDSHVLILDGDTPAFVAAEQPFFADGPLWRIELVSLQGPRPSK